MKIKEFIENVAMVSKTHITELAKTELTNENKKLMLDEKIVNYVELAISQLSLNIFLKTLLKRLLLPNVSVITQIIFDLLKEKIEGVTK